MIWAISFGYFVWKERKIGAISDAATKRFGHSSGTVPDRSPNLPERSSDRGDRLTCRQITRRFGRRGRQP